MHFEESSQTVLMCSLVCEKLVQTTLGGKLRKEKHLSGFKYCLGRASWREIMRKRDKGVIIANKFSAGTEWHNDKHGRTTRLRQEKKPTSALEKKAWRKHGHKTQSTDWVAENRYFQAFLKAKPPPESEERCHEVGHSIQVQKAWSSWLLCKLRHYVFFVLERSVKKPLISILYVP